MDAKMIFIQMQGANANYTMDHARVMEAYGLDHGLTPFAEFHPMLFKNKSTGKYQVAFKDHYSLVQRWAQDRGGYRRTWHRIDAPKGDISVEVSVISNRDYSIVLTACQYGADRAEEMAAYEHKAQATCTAEEYRDKKRTGKSQEWFALKRATEAALIECFGKEPAQARQIYSANVLTTEGARSAASALYPPQEHEALPAPAVTVVDGEYTDDFDAEADYEALQGVISGEAERYAEQTGATEAARSTGDYIEAIEFGVFDTQKGGNLHIGFMAADEKWPSVRWWNGRDALIEAAPWIGGMATKDELADLGRRWTCPMRVQYETNDKGYKTATAFELIGA